MTHAAEAAADNPGIVDTTKSAHARLRPVPVNAVRLHAGFWPPRLQANRREAVPRLLALLEDHGVLDNFRRVSGRKPCERRGPLFTDSDLYKWMEAAALSLQSEDDAELRGTLDAVIDDVLAAQGSDGYLNTWYVDERADKRFTNLPVDHELYCAGHLFQAAVAHFRATGRRTLLDGAIRFADYLCEMFGPDRTIQGHGGHPEIEMALVELYRTTGQRMYLELAGYFLDDMKFTDTPELRGHAVRQVYACAGAVDYYAESGDPAFRSANDRLWEDLVRGKMYVTGGVGSRHVHEAFGDPFELPHLRSYAETCAAIGNAMWNWRLLAVTGEARHADLFERILYNGFLCGVSLSGTEYFYANPLASHHGARRAAWYDCTCCPPNVQRMIASVPGYLFGTSDRGLYVHLYDNCRLDWKLANGMGLAVGVSTRYPWDGHIALTIAPEEPARFELSLRIPGWCREAQVSVNGQTADAAVEPGTYCRLDREWRPDDTVVLDLAMPVEAVVADPRVSDCRGCIALMRGPIVYCLEGVDHPGVDLDRVQVPIDPRRQFDFEAVHQPDLLGGVTVLRGPAVEIDTRGRALYTPLDSVPESSPRDIDVTAIPYYAWANREPPSMKVWLPYEAAK